MAKAKGQQAVLATLAPTYLVLQVLCKASLACPSTIKVYEERHSLLMAYMWGEHAASVQTGQATAECVLLDP